MIPGGNPGHDARPAGALLGAVGAQHRAIEHVGLQLHQHVVGGGAAIGGEPVQGCGEIGLHGAKDVRDLQGDGFQRRAGEMGRLVESERPRTVPRAAASQYGAPSPASAGTKHAPALSGTVAARSARAAGPGRPSSRP